MKLIRCNEDENDLERSLQAEDEKIVLVQRSASTLQCSLCPNKYQGSLSITEHVKNVHKLAHMDEKYVTLKIQINDANELIDLSGFFSVLGNGTYNFLWTRV